MMRQQLWLAFDGISEVLLQSRSDAGVQFLSPAAQQGAVSGVLDQGVLEQVGSVRRNTTAKQKASFGQARQRSLQFGLTALRNRLDQVVREFAADHGSDLCNLPGRRPDPVKPRKQRGMQGRGY